MTKSDDRDLYTEYTEEGGLRGVFFETLNFFWECVFDEIESEIVKIFCAR